MCRNRGRGGYGIGNKKNRRTCGGETDRNSNVMQDQASKT